MSHHIYFACFERMGRVRTPLVLPVHVHSGQFSVGDGVEDSVEDIGREHETGAAASFEGGAGSDVSSHSKYKGTRALCALGLNGIVGW